MDERESILPDGEQFQIGVPASQGGDTRSLKHSNTFAVFDGYGDIVGLAGGAEGIFHRDTRYLSNLRLSISGHRPILLSSSMRDDNGALICDLTNPDLHRPSCATLVHDLIHLRRLKFLWNNTSFERLAIRNFGELRSRVTIQIDFAADFADIFEVRGNQRERRGTYQRPEIDSDSVVISYMGLDDRKRQTQLRFHPIPTLLRSDRAIFEIDLAARESASIFIEVRCDSIASNVAPWKLFFSSLRDARRDLRTVTARAAVAETSNDIFNEVIRRSAADLYMLTTDLAEGPYPYAGIPWFSTVFGRDALITALETLWIDPSIARGVLLHLAANQAQESNVANDAEPGKILHEARQGEMAELGEVPFRRYYGSVDSTPLFIMLAGAYLERTDDVATLVKLWPHIAAALKWIDVHGDFDGDGFVEYGRKSDNGLVNQGWKDSHDSIFHADGVLAEGPIALVEVQGYVYAAKRAAASIARRTGLDGSAALLDQQAATLQTRFDDHFWDEGLGTYVLALDGEKRPCRVRTSNAGHALFSGIALSKRAPSIVRNLMNSISFCGWGIRTVAASEARYNPMSYHNGSVWPHDNALIAFGLASYGFSAEVTKVFKGLFEAAVHIDLRRLPELLCGFARVPSQGPTFYPVACSPQAWAAAAPLALIVASLGLSFDPRGRRVVFKNPHLPDFLEHITLRRLTMGDAHISVRLRRIGTDIALHVIESQGDISAMTIG